jgi:hypothetical protein
LAKVLPTPRSATTGDLDGSTGTLQYSLNDGSTAGTYFRNPTSVMNASTSGGVELRKPMHAMSKRQGSTARA